MKNPAGISREVEIRPLTQADELGSFSCGVPELDRFIEHYARPNQFELHSSFTYVAVTGGQVVGFASVVCCGLERGGARSPGPPRSATPLSLPVLRLARLAVDERARGLGLGRALLQHVLRLAVSEPGECEGVVVDAGAGSVSFYEALGFVRCGEVREGLLLDEPLPMFIGRAELRRAQAER